MTNRTVKIISTSAFSLFWIIMVLISASQIGWGLWVYLFLAFGIIPTGIEVIKLIRNKDDIMLDKTVEDTVKDRIDNYKSIYEYEKGLYESDIPMIMKCRKCQLEHEVKIGDISRAMTLTSTRGYERESYKKLFCPNCNKKTWHIDSEQGAYGSHVTEHTLMHRMNVQNMINKGIMSPENANEER